MLLAIENVLNTDELAHIRKRLAEASFVDGRVTAGQQSAQVKQNLQLAETAPLTAELRGIVLAALARNAMFTSAALPKRIFPPLFNRYAEGMYFGNHVDNAIRGREDAIRTDVSCTLFLADPDSYDGGELVVDDTYGAHEVKLNAGDMILYPSTSVHRVLPVTRGHRDACFFWLQSMVRDDGQRNLLFNLDVAIQRLKVRLDEAEDSAEIVALTATYHNLLRQWAEL